MNVQSDAQFPPQKICEWKNGVPVFLKEKKTQAKQQRRESEEQRKSVQTGGCA